MGGAVATDITIKTAVGYFRVFSTAGQARERHVSLDVQQAVFQAYCKAHHLVQIAIFTDAASGRKDARIQYQAMPARLAQGGIGDLVVLFMDRFAETLGRPSVGIGIFKSGAQPLNPSMRT